MTYAIKVLRETKPSAIHLKNGKLFYYKRIVECSYPACYSLPEGLTLYTVGQKSGAIVPPELLPSGMFKKLNPGVRSDIFELLGVYQDIRKADKIKKQVRAIPKTLGEAPLKPEGALIPLDPGSSRKAYSPIGVGKTYLSPPDSGDRREEIISRALGIVEGITTFGNRVLDFVESMVRT